MGVNKVKYGQTTVIDISNDTVTANKLIEGYTAHDNTGTLIVGTAQEGGDVPVWQGADDYVYFSDTISPPYEISMIDGYVVIDLPPAVLQTKTRTYTPTTSQQTDVITADVGYDGLEEVNITINPIPYEDGDDVAYGSELTDLTGTTWVFNNSLTSFRAPRKEDILITFSSNSNTYYGIGLTSYQGTVETIVYYLDNAMSTFHTAYYYSWLNENYKTISITGGTDATDTELIAWFQANATKQ